MLKNVSAYFLSKSLDVKNSTVHGESVIQNGNIAARVFPVPHGDCTKTF